MGHDLGAQRVQPDFSVAETPAQTDRVENHQPPDEGYEPQSYRPVHAKTLHAAAAGAE
jgi:hypothetical protein